MELYAKCGHNQIRIQKRGPSFSSLMTLRDAREAYEKGRITKTNRLMQRLIDNDFDVKKTLEEVRK